MKKIKLTIGNKILGGFLLLIFIFGLNALFSIYTLNISQTIIEENESVIKPSVDALNELTLMATESKMFITNWVYLQSNVDDKEALKTLHEIEYPQLKEELNILKQDWTQEQQWAIDSIFITFDDLLRTEKDIMSQLVTYEDYDDPFLVMEVRDKLDMEVLPATRSLTEQLNRITAIKQEEANIGQASLINSFEELRITILALGAFTIGIGLLGAFFLARSITVPIKKIKETIVKLGNGILPNDEKRKYSGDEIGEMAMAVDNLVSGLRSTSAFAENIGNGQYDAEYSPLSEEDVLGNSLLGMRNNLKKVAEEDKKRNWATEGMARFGEILRKNNDNIERLSDEIISNIVKYLKANQGGLYIVEDDEKEEDAYLKLTACYAWDKKKYIDQKIYKGDGLAGQAWLEKDIVYITDVPEDYIKITSGLGEANPTSILIVPLKVNDEIYGVIELASFDEISDFEKEFVEKIGESIASTISSVKINERTHRLLQESTEMTEEMRSQEEEMRQNMEELQATQEEMERAQRDREEKENIMYATNMVVELDGDFRITSSNPKATDILKYTSDELLGNPLDALVTSKESLNEFKERVTAGNPWSGLFTVTNKKKKDVVLKISAGRIYDAQKGSNKFLVFATEITEVAVI